MPAATPTPAASRAPRTRPGPALLACAIAFAAVGVQSLVKPFAPDDGIGFVVLGVRTDGWVEAVAARVHAAFALTLAWGIFRLRRFALWLVALYLPYVALNFGLFLARYGVTVPLGFGIPWVIVAFGVPAATATLLFRRRRALT